MMGTDHELSSQFASDMLSSRSPPMPDMVTYPPA